MEERKYRCFRQLKSMKSDRIPKYNRLECRGEEEKCVAKGEVAGARRS